MDWLHRSIGTSCVATTTTISGASLAIRVFVRQFRGARAVLEGISAELHSLDSVLDLLKDDAPSLPVDLARQTPRVLDQCLAVVSELEGCIRQLSAQNGVSFLAVESTARWRASRLKVVNLGVALQAFRLTFGLISDVVSYGDNAGPKGASEYESNGPQGTWTALPFQAQIHLLKTQLSNEMWQNSLYVCLETYLESLEAQVEDVKSATRASQYVFHRRSTSSSSISSSSVHGSDSAIDMNEDPPSSGCRGYLPLARLSAVAEAGTEPIYDIFDIPSRAPTPPPKSPARQRLSICDTSASFAPVEVPKRCASACERRSKEPYVFVTRLEPVPALDKRTTGREPNIKGGTAVAKKARATANTGNGRVTRHGSIRSSLKRLSWIWDVTDITDERAEPHIMPVSRF